MGGRLSEIDAWRGEIRAGALKGPRIFRAGPMLNGRFSDYQLLVTNAPEARGAVRALQRAGVDLIKLHRMTPRKAYFGIAEEAKNLGIPFAGHIPRTVSPEEASDAGQWTFEHVETLFEGTFSNARDDIPLAEPIESFKSDGARELFERFAKNGNWWTPTLAAFEAANLRFWDEKPHATDLYVSRRSWEMIEQIRKSPPPKGWLEDRKAQFPHHRDLVAMAQRLGVGLLAGTDMAARIAPGASLHRELELLVESGLSPLQALCTATTNPAQAIGRDDLGARLCRGESRTWFFSGVIPWTTSATSGRSRPSSRGERITIAKPWTTCSPPASRLRRFANATPPGDDATYRWTARRAGVKLCEPMGRHQRGPAAPSAMRQGTQRAIRASIDFTTQARISGAFPIRFWAPPIP